MSRFIKEINDSPITAERAEKDILGNQIDTAYQRQPRCGNSHNGHSRYVGRPMTT